MNVKWCVHNADGLLASLALDGTAKINHQRPKPPDRPHFLFLEQFIIMTNSILKILNLTGKIYLSCINLVIVTSP